MPFVRVRDIDVYYEIHGEGPPLLFFNGTGGDLRRKPSVFDSPLTRHFTMLAHDQRGLGQTTTPETQPTMADYAADADALLDAMDWEQCPVIGISFGGMVAQEFALRFSHRVTRLVLACTSSGGAGGASYPLHEMNEWAPHARMRKQIELSDTRLDAAWQARHPDIVQNLVVQQAPLTRGAVMQLEARRGHDTYDRLAMLRMPVYVCGGERDQIAPQANVEALAARIPSAKLELFDGGHLFMAQDPRAWPAIIDFLRG
jgi:3-oxoadipate enol-lactonase